MKIIVGLGNPGKEYEKTRHNIGWMVLDSFLGNVQWQENKKLNALIYKHQDYLFVKPTTFMNKSGETVQKILHYYKLNPKILGILRKKNNDLSNTLLVIHDDLDLDFGTKKIVNNSSSAGHNGVQSIIDNLKTKNFTRLRLGIGNDLLRTQIIPSKFVLQSFNSEERKKLPGLIKNINIITII